jgi:hypothetical protein
MLIRKSNGLMITLRHLAAVIADREVVSGSTAIAQASLRDKAFRDMDFSASPPATVKHGVAADDIRGALNDLSPALRLVICRHSGSAPDLISRRTERPYPNVPVSEE